MYEQHFGLRTMPFRVVPSPRFLFPSDTHEESRARILYGIRENRGFVVVSGAVGLGKTTVLLSVLEELDASLETALIVHPVSTFKDLLRLVCLEFGIDTSSQDEVTMLWELNLYLVERLAEGKKCVLMIDEAQNVPLEVLERVRTLSNLQTESSSLLQIVLVGQPELLTHLDDPRLPQLRQRVGVWHEILPLTAEETRNYVWHRLELAGAGDARTIMPAAVCARVHEASGGVPRLVNQLCDTALVIAYGQGRSAVGTEEIEEARRELRLDTAPAESGVPETSGATTPSPSPSKAPERVADPVPRETTAAADPGRSPARSGGPPLAAAAVLILLLLAAVRFGVIPGWPLSGATAADDQEPEIALEATHDDPVDVAEAASEEPEPAPVATRSLPETWREADLRVERWREAGRNVFSAHLASFRGADGVARFADSLVTAHPEWDAPLYVEITRDDPSWHRVYGGGFASRTEALRFARSIKAQGAVQFANVERLGPKVRTLVPTVFEAPRTSNPGESG